MNHSIQPPFYYTLFTFNNVCFYTQMNKTLYFKLKKTSITFNLNVKGFTQQF